MDAEEFKELALEMTDCADESLESVRRLIGLLKGSPLVVICGGRASGKTALLATIVKLLNGDCYYLDEGAHCQLDPHDLNNRAQWMRDRARQSQKSSFLTVSMSRNAGPNDDFLANFAMQYPPPAHVTFIADAAVYMNRTGWKIIKSRQGPAGDHGHFELEHLLADRTAYDNVLYRSNQRPCKTDQQTEQEERIVNRGWRNMVRLVHGIDLAAGPDRTGFQIIGTRTGRIALA